MTEEFSNGVLFLPRSSDPEGFTEVKVHPLDKKPVLPCDQMNIGTYLYTVCPADIVGDYLHDLYCAMGVNYSKLFADFRLVAEQVHADQYDVYQERKDNATEILNAIGQPICKAGIVQAENLCMAKDTHPYIRMKAQHYLQDASDEFYRFYNLKPNSEPGRHCLKEATRLAKIAKPTKSGEED